jgi:hypothetical protein
MHKHSISVFGIILPFSQLKLWLWAFLCLFTASSMDAVDLSSLSHLPDLGPMLAQAAPPDIKEGLKKVIDLIMLFGFVMGVVLIIRGAWENRQGGSGKESIVNGSVIAGAVAIMTFLYKAFGLASTSLPF